MHLRISLFIVFLFSLSSFFPGCDGQQSSKKNGTVYISGTIKNPNHPSISFLTRKFPFSYMDTTMAQANLENGRFTAKFHLKAPTYGLLQYGGAQKRIYLTPGDSLEISLDATSIGKSLEFSGKGAGANNSLIRRSTLLTTLDKENKFGINMDTSQFHDIIEVKRELLREFHTQYFSEHPDVPERFKELEKKRTLFTWARRKFTYPNIYQYQANTADSTLFSDKYWAFLDTIQLNNPENLVIPEYLSFAYKVANKYALDLKKKKNKKAINYRELLFITIEQEFEGKVRDALLTYFMLEQFDLGKPKQTRELLKKYQKSITDKEQLQFINKVKKHSPS